MKNLINYLKTLWSWVADSQSTDVSVDRRLTVGSPSGLESSTVLKFVSVLVLVLTIGVGNVWAVDLKTSDLDFGTPGKSENFNAVNTVSTKGKSGSTTTVTNYTTYGIFTHGYIGKSTSDGYAIKAAADPMTSKYLEITTTTKGAGMSFSHTFATKGAFSFTIAKTSKTFIGLYAAVANSTIYAKANSSVYLYFTGSKIQINSGSGWVDAVTDMSSLPNAFDVTVIYNNTTTADEYGDGVSIGAKRAHIFVNGTAVMNGSSPKEFTIPGASLTAFRVMCNVAGTSKVDDIKVYDALPTAAAPACTAPNHVDISGDWDKFGGETISLTATAYSSAGTGSPIADANITGWQWQKLVSSTWTNVSNGTVSGSTTSGATTKNLQITNCTKDHSGKYRCVVSTGATCSTPSATKTDGTEGHGVKVYVLECYNSGTTVYNFTRTGSSKAGTVEIDLSASTNYTFKVHADVDYYGNNGTVNEDITNWEMSTSEGNMTVASGLGGTFTFSMDYSTGGNNSTEGIPEISVTYPRKTIYLTPGVWNTDGAKFAIYYFRKVGETLYGNGWTDFITANDCGSSADIPQWNGVKMDVVRLKNTTETPNWGDKWAQTNDITVSSNDYVTITGWNESDYTYTAYAIPTYTISYAKGTVPTGGGSISGSRDSESKTCGTAFTLPSSAVFTTTGYTQDGWATEDGGSKDYNLGGSYTTNAAQAFYPHWNANTYTLTWNLNGGTVTTAGTGAAVDATGSPSSSVAFNSDITAPVVEKDGYDFDGWNTTPATKMPAANTTYTAQWSLKSYTVTWYAGGTSAGNITTAGSPTTNVNHGSKVTTLPTNPDGSGCDKVFVGWTNTTSYTHGTSLLFTNAAGSPTITGVTNFYAVYATSGGTGDPTNKFSVTLNTSSPSAPSGYTLTHATEWKNSTHRQDGSNDPAYVKIYHTSTKLFSSLPSTITIKAGLYGGSARDMSEDGSDYYPYVFFTDNAGNEIAGSAKAICTSVTASSDEKSVNMDVSKATNAYGIGIRHKKITGFNLRYSSITLAYAETSYTGHTITCTSCSNEVTVSFSAPGSGNTMTVAKGVTSLSSGDAVKTCSAVSLTVTLTPAAHYTADGLSATGVTGVTTSHVGNVYTVNIPADKTGTLTLTPTFTAETPLTITLDTHSKGTFTPIGTIYSGDSFTFPEVTPNDAECADFVGWVEGTSIAEEGTSTEPTTIAAGSSSGTLTTNKTYTAVYAEKDKTESDAYVKVTSSLSNWSGTYLIVHDGSSRALDGSLTTTLGSTGDYFSVSITDGAIAATSTLATKNWTIAKIGETSTYTIKSASGYYIGRATASNGLDYTTTAGDADANSITYSSGVSIAGSASTAKLQYWVSGANACFKYYTSSQNAVSLYKLGTAEVVTYTYTVNPACTAKYRVTVNSATGGSPTADPKYLPEGETVTLTANPAAGYTFTSWTITKTTGGDNVTSTLLTGDKPTTANTSFAMPAYDVTVTATYAKIYVTSVVAKEGETTLNTSDHKLNINTGANKTVTVVVTPADAFDHSWSAEVTSGGTYASISNVTSEGFRVNGLAEGDATIVVTAPNDDGTDRTATFTVHVTDVLPEEIILKRDGSVAEIEELTMYYDEANSRGQYVKVNVSYSPTPTNKNFTFSSAATGKVGSHSHSNVNLYEVLVANGVTSSPVNCTFTSEADGSVTKVLAVTVLPLLTDRFVDYIQGNATQTVSARLSTDRYDIITDINTPSISDASDANPTSEDCKTAHYHMIGWLPQATAEALWAAGTAITEDTEGLVSAGATVEATGQTWYAIWAKEE